MVRAFWGLVYMAGFRAESGQSILNAGKNGGEAAQPNAGYPVFSQWLRDSYLFLASCSQTHPLAQQARMARGTTTEGALPSPPSALPRLTRAGILIGLAAIFLFLFLICKSVADPNGPEDLILSACHRLVLTVCLRAQRAKDSDWRVPGRLPSGLCWVLGHPRNHPAPNPQGQSLQPRHRRQGARTPRGRHQRWCGQGRRRRRG